MTILGIETSCDETSVAIVEARGLPAQAGAYPALECRIRSHLVHSQVDVHSKYGGVFPMMAKREHAKRLVPLLEQAIAESGIGTEAFEPGAELLETVKKICGKHDEDLYRSIIGSSLATRKPALDRIAATHGPGLEPALWVGVNFANALSALWNVPAEGVNHMEGHIAASLAPKSEPRQAFTRLLECPFPAIALLVSGGHTEIVLCKGIGDYRILGATRDDAVGEAFDKVARMLGLPYPGGPEISRLAEIARKEKNRKAQADAFLGGTLGGAKSAERERGVSTLRRGPDEEGHPPEPPIQAISASVESAISLPRPMIGADSLDMSFSGLKTAVLYELKKHPEITDELKQAVAREFEDAVTETIVAKLEKAFSENEACALIAGGGVMGNRHILAACADLAERRGIPFFPPAPGLSGDNALMIALVAALAGEGAPKKPGVPLAAQGNLSFMI